MAVSLLDHLMGRFFSPSAAFFKSRPKSFLKHELHADLNRSGPVRVYGMQERIAREAGTITRRIRRATITIDHVVAGIARVHGVVHPELGVVESIERFEPELQSVAFFDFHVLQQGHIKVKAAWVVQEISPRVSVGQPFWSRKLRRISQQRAETAPNHTIGSWLVGSRRVRNNVWIRSRSCNGGDAG